MKVSRGIRLEKQGTAYCGSQPRWRCPDVVGMNGMEYIGRGISRWESIGVLGGRFWSRGKMGFSVGLPQVTAMLGKKDVA